MEVIAWIRSIFIWTPARLVAGRKQVSEADGAATDLAPPLRRRAEASSPLGPNQLLAGFFGRESEMTVFQQR